MCYNYLYLGDVITVGVHFAQLLYITEYIYRYPTLLQTSRWSS